MAKLLLVRGLPGSGKSTYAKEYVKDHTHKFPRETWVNYEADMWVDKDENGAYVFDPGKKKLYHARCLSAAFRALLLDCNVVVSNTFCQYREMMPYFDIAERAEAKVSIYVCKGEYENIHQVPEDTLNNMRGRWEE